MSYKFSGHETFPFRYTWLPKAYRAIDSRATALNDEEDAMVHLGVGKNMLRAIKFWMQVTGAAVPADGCGYVATDFGKAILADEGFDPFLEDIRTLWLLHWKISSRVEEPLFAWDFILNHWQHPEISRTEVLRVLRQEVARMERPVSDVTLTQHFDIFLHTYVSSGGSSGGFEEDSLDCPLVELDLLQYVGERKLDASGRRERIYAFRREAKPEITPGVFLFCLNDFWLTHRPHERTLSFRDVSVAKGSPGQILKLPEQDLRERLETIRDDSAGLFEYGDSSGLPQVIRAVEPIHNLLSNVYQREGVYA